jgi:hypothetical protein
VNHHLYADDTQLYSCFSGTDFCHNISHRENSIALVHNWTSSSFLALNPSKTEFLIIGLPQQLAKTQSSYYIFPKSVTLSSVGSARNLVVIFDSILSFSEQTSAISKSCRYHIRDL